MCTRQLLTEGASEAVLSPVEAAAGGAHGSINSNVITTILLMYKLIYSVCCYFSYAAILN